MVKFADLHKNLDDAFNKDFIHGQANLEHKQAYDAADMAKGSTTFKLNHSPVVGSTSSVVECKSTLGSNVFGLKFLDGVVVTEKMSDKGGINMKFEKACCEGSKTTYDFDYDWASKACNKANLAFDYSNSKATLGLKLAQSGESAMCSVPGKVSAHVTGGLGAHNLGANLDYNVKSGALDHHLKFKLNHGKGYACVGMKNAENFQFLLSQKIGQDISFGPLGALHVRDGHVKSSYNIKDGSYAAALAWESDYNLGDWKCGLKSTYNPLNGEFQESSNFKMNDALSAKISNKHNVHKGFLADFQIGAALNFSL